MSAPAIVLCRTKYSENIGSVARACANMGCGNIILVSPRDFNPDRAAPLATNKGMRILEESRRVDELDEAISGFHDVYATTARIGGWRKGILNPGQAARDIAEGVASRKSAAVVFGPEDTGLTNREIQMCGRLISIPTESDAWSLNISQAVLIILYECFKIIPKQPGTYHDRGQGAYITQDERLILYSHIQKALMDIDYIHPENPDYFMMAVKRFLNKVEFRRNEFNLLMGVCRQIGWLKSLTDGGGKNDQGN